MAMGYRRSALFPASNRIVLGGTACPAGDNYDFAVAQLLPDGALDPGFGVGGKTTVGFDLGGANVDSLHGLALETIGLALGGPTHILLAGAAQGPASNLWDLALARLDGAGTLDPGFGVGGKAVIPIDQGGANGDRANAVAVAGGRAFLAGDVQTDLNAGNDTDFLVARIFASDIIFADGFER